MLQTKVGNLGRLSVDEAAGSEAHLTERESLPDRTGVSLAESQAHERSRVKLLIERDLSKLDIGHFRTYDDNQTCFENAEAAFDHLMTVSELSTELTPHELRAYKKRFIDEMHFDCKHDPEVFKNWAKDTAAAAQNEKPVMTERLAKSLNDAHLSYTVRMEEWLVHESAMSYSARLGKKVTPEKNRTMFAQTQEYYSRRRDEAARAPPVAFDSRTEWPRCARIIGRIHNQGVCGSCWAFGALSSVDSRLCISSGGAFSGSRAQLSRGYSTSCAKEQGCNGGLASYVYELLASAGIPTGGDQGCTPYWGIGEGTDHFEVQQGAPPCPTSCVLGYERSLGNDKTVSPGSRRYREIWPTNAQGNIDAKISMMTYGPLSFGIYANGPFSGYAGGIFDSGCGENPNHEVVAIGWGQGYIIGLNSWGRHWGDNGGFKVADCVVTDWTIPGDLTGVKFPDDYASGPAPPPPPPSTWTVSGDCITEDNCVMSKNYPLPYGVNERCTISKEFGEIQVLGFQTEYGYDKMTVNGNSYSGLSGPHGIVSTTDIVWSSDYSVEAAGWKICTTPPLGIGR